MGMRQLLAGRINIGSWRARRQALWVTCIMAGLFLIYVQWTPSGPIIIDGELQSDHQQFLHTGSSDSRVARSNDDNNKVNFIAKKNSEKKKEFSSSKNKKKNTYEGKKSDEEQDSIDMVNKDKFKKSDEEQDSIVMVNKDKLSNVQADSVKNDNNNINGAFSWNGGAFKYNPYGEPVYDHGNRPNYVPSERLVHLDLKGAPPLMAVFKTLIPWLAKYGATSILIEYEDMFPWEGPLASIAAKNHYSKEDVKSILTICKENNMKVIPLVQTFGHLEFALKVSDFMELREISNLPQAICPSNNKTATLLHHLIDQTMALHPDSKFLHIGCDEVFQMGECDRCRLKTHESLFLDHVSSIAKYVRNVHRVKPIIWHDMLSHVSESAMKEINFGDLVEPMVWVYAEDVYRFVQPTQWSKLGAVFSHVWGASAFKGAFGEQATVPNVRRHLDNNLNWLDVMATEQTKFSGGFRGLALTGWQRFDHFAVLCELLPASMPSLAINLIAMSHGYFNSSVHAQLYESLQCVQAPKYQTGLNLDADPYLWDKFSWCFFPGALVFKTTSRLDSAKRDVRAYVDRVTLSRGWISDYNRRHNFSSPFRVDEDLEELPGKLHTVTLLLKTANDALTEWFDEYTVGEWIEQHIWPLLHQLETLQRESLSMKNVKTWPVRPLPLLSELKSFGITEKPQKTSADDSDFHKSPKADYFKQKLKYVLTT